MHRRCVTAGVPLPGAGRRATWPGLVRAPAALVGFDPSRCCSRPRVSGRLRPSDPPAVSPAARTDNRAAPLGVTRNVCRWPAASPACAGDDSPVTRATSRGMQTGATAAGVFRRPRAYRPRLLGFVPAGGPCPAAPRRRMDVRTGFPWCGRFRRGAAKPDTAMGFCLSQVFVTGAPSDSAPSAVRDDRGASPVNVPARRRVSSVVDGVHSPSPSAVGPRFQRPLTLVGFSVRRTDVTGDLRLCSRLPPVTS
jgi:hypothetical protein